MHPPYRAAGADSEQLDDTLAFYDRLISLEPKRIEAYEAKANSLYELGRPREALEALECAIQLKPRDPRLLWKASLCYLQLGDYSRGWQLYGSRHGFLFSKTASGADRTARVRPQHLWTGRQSLTGKTLFVQCEQGLGDLIQFSRYVPVLENSGARVILSAPWKMHRLLRSLSANTLLTNEEDPRPAADHDCMLLGLPAACATTVETIPATVPYLRAEPERVAHWKRLLGGEELKVGICWQGKPGPADAGRSCPVSSFAPLAAIPGVRLISLQKGAGANQLFDSSAPPGVVDLGADFDAGADAFVDTAAVMQLLDLVITIDSAVAHLAGALGIPAWIALKACADWRWLLERPDSPWYPSLRLFRQPSIGDWSAVFSAMRREFSDLLSPRAPSHRARA